MCVKKLKNKIKNPVFGCVVGPESWYCVWISPVELAITKETLGELAVTLKVCPRNTDDGTDDDDDDDDSCKVVVVEDPEIKEEEKTLETPLFGDDKVVYDLEAAMLESKILDLDVGEENKFSVFCPLGEVAELVVAKVEKEDFVAVLDSENFPADDKLPKALSPLVTKLVSDTLSNKLLNLEISDPVLHKGVAGVA